MGGQKDLTNIKGGVMTSGLFTWNGCEELDSVSVTVEGELSVSHRAERHEGPGCHSVTALVAVDADASWWIT